MKKTIPSSEWLSEPDVQDGDEDIAQDFPQVHEAAPYARPALAQVVAPTVVSRLVRKSAPGLTVRTSFH